VWEEASLNIRLILLVLKYDRYGSEGINFIGLEKIETIK